MEILSSLAISSVWSGHPVGFDLLTHKGHQFIAFYDADRKMTVGQRKLGDEAFELVRLAGIWLEERGRLSTDLAWDSHNSITMTVDRNEQIHLCGNMHVDPLIYFRTVRPLDVTSFQRLDRMVGENEDRCTYPVFMKGPGGELIFRFRDGKSGNGVDFFNRYEEASQSWARLVDTPLLDGMGLMNAYANMPCLGPDGRYHMNWMWRDTPDCATNHDISYARSPNLVDWEGGDGTRLELPITVRDKASIADPVPAGGGAINMCQSLGFDSQQRPCISYHKHDEEGKTQAYVARMEERWKVYKLSSWDYRWEFGGGGSIAAEIRLGGVTPLSDGFAAVDWWHIKDGTGTWRLDEETMEVVGAYEKPSGDLQWEWLNETREEDDFMSPKSDYPGMAVRTLPSQGESVPGRRFVLRWETLAANRDYPREEIPPPSELRLYTFGRRGNRRLPKVHATR